MKLEAENVGVGYGIRVAVAGVDLAARPGELPAILGANGSGKSSLLCVLAGVQAHSGQVLWDGGTTAAGSIGCTPHDSGGRMVGRGLPSEILQPAFAVTVAVGHGSNGHPVVLPLRAILP